MRASRRNRHGDSPLQLTSMIDVVFLLLVFFVVTADPADLIGRIEVDRPSPASEPGTPEPPGLTIRVYESGYFVGHIRVNDDRLDRILADVSERSPDQRIVVMCEQGSLHGQLVRVLDLCAKSGLAKVSVLSLSTG